MPDGGLSWGTIAAIGGVLVNLIFNSINFITNRNTRRNAVALESFSSHVRAPVQDALQRLSSIMDEADDIVRSAHSHDDKIKATIGLSKKFHAARRVLARLLNDCDKSVIVAGDDWSRCDEGHMDDATDAFERAARADDEIKLRNELHKVAISIDSLRSQLIARLDQEAKRLMS